MRTESQAVGWDCCARRSHVPDTESQQAGEPVTGPAHLQDEVQAAGSCAAALSGAPGRLALQQAPDGCVWLGLQGLGPAESCLLLLLILGPICCALVSCRVSGDCAWREGVWLVWRPVVFCTCMTPCNMPGMHDLIHCSDQPGTGTPT